LITKKCSKCGQTKDISEFYELKYNTITMKDGAIKWVGPRYESQCKECMKLYMKIYGYLNGDGCCLYCGEINPFMLNNHHIFGRKNNDFTITLCENHHAAFTRRLPLVLEKWCVPTANKRTNRSA